MTHNLENQRCCPHYYCPQIKPVAYWHPQLSSRSTVTYAHQSPPQPTLISISEALVVRERERVR